MAKITNSVKQSLKSTDSRTAQLLVFIANALADMNIDIGDINVDMTSVENLLQGVGGTERTPSYTIVSDATSVAAGKYKVQFYNTGGSNGTVLGTTLAPNASITFETRDADTLGAIAYVATGTTFAITTIA